MFYNIARDFLIFRWELFFYLLKTKLDDKIETFRLAFFDIFEKLNISDDILFIEI